MGSRRPRVRRVAQRDGEHVACRAWQAALEAHADQAGSNTVLVAHSVGYLLVEHWAARKRLRLMGALLVVVPDPAGDAFPPLATGFAPVPRATLPFPGILVASRNDPHASLDFARACAHDRGSEFAGIGAAGHIDADSGFGDWREGKALLRRLSG
ncbi:MAG: alpha/beta hydrolase [Rudaea sp.]